MAVATHDAQCEDGLTGMLGMGGTVVLCMCLDRYMKVNWPVPPATPRNLHVLVVKESDVTVHAAAYATHTDALHGWSNFVCEAAQPNTVLFDELLKLSLKCEREPSTTARELIDYGISFIDLIDWWIGRQEGNEARIFEVQDKR